MTTIEEIRVAEARVKEAEATAEILLKKLKKMKPEQRKIQENKEEFRKLEAKTDSNPDTVREERKKLNKHIEDYNRRRQATERRYNEAKQLVEELKKIVETFKNILEEKESVSSKLVSESDSLPPDSQSPDLVSSFDSVQSTSEEQAAINKALFELKIVQYVTRIKRLEYDSILSDEENKKNKLLELILKYHSSADLTLVTGILLTKTDA